MSDTGWGTCYSCHPSGLTDTVTWMFADGPRQAISMESTFEFGAAKIVNGAPALPDSHQRALNWSAVRDEVQDFTRNVRAVSGGGGLVKIDANGAAVPEGTAGLAQLPDLRPTANSGLSADLDAIATYLALGVRAPISPVPSHNVGAQLGRVIFEAQGCQNCHGGKNWTISALDYTPPPVATEIVDAQLVRFLCRVGTFDPALFSDNVSNEIRANAAANTQARGVLGFNVPSLISVFASAPYLHSGAAASLDDVLGNVTHRTAGRADHHGFAGRASFPAAPGTVRQVDRSGHPADPERQPAVGCLRTTIDSCPRHQPSSSTSHQGPACLAGPFALSDQVEPSDGATFRGRAVRAGGGLKSTDARIDSIVQWIQLHASCVI